MSIVRTTAISLLAMFAIVETTAEAFADHRHRIWPRVYVPFFNEFDGPSDYYYDEQEDVVVYPRRKRHRDVVRDYYDEQDLEPVYEEPVKPKKKKKAVASKPAAKPGSTATVVVKPKVKPATKPVETASLAKTEAAPVTKSALTPSPKALPDFEIKGGTDAVSPTTTLSTKGSAPVPVAPKATTASKPAAVTSGAAVKPATQTNAAKANPAPAKVASAASPAATGATPKGAIACSKGAEIVSGYGFTSVKPKLCNGATYSFDASRAANAYVIKVSSATGEITDVQKVK
ncbi:MAG: hypothetical protein JNM45_08185 [Rhizobiales bacterium]|nr:hypothetical protein [Hyphomicrobiales bacterium]